MHESTHEGRITLLLGVTGAGKSTHLRQLLASPTIDRFLCWDLKGEFGRDGSISARRWPTLRALLEHVRGGAPHGREIVRASVREFPAMLRYAYTAGNMLLVIEELSAFCTADKFPRDEVLDLAHRSRERGLDVVIVAQRPLRMPTDLRSQAKDFVVYRLDDPLDVRELQNQLALTDAAVLPVRSLTRGVFRKWSRGF